MQYVQEKLLNNFQTQIVPVMKEWNNIYYTASWEQ